MLFGVDMQLCTLECLTNLKTIPTVVPLMVKDEIFQGSNCPIYQVCKNNTSTPYNFSIMEFFRKAVKDTANHQVRPTR